MSEPRSDGQPCTCGGRPYEIGGAAHREGCGLPETDHWCTVADGVAARLAAAEEELATTKARMREELHRRYAGGEFCLGTYEALRSCLNAAGAL